MQILPRAVSLPMRLVYLHNKPEGNLPQFDSGLHFGHLSEGGMLLRAVS
jgi:hypothetical protein